MQLLALVLLLGAGGLLAATIVTGVVAWAWGSVALSVMAAVVLGAHRVQRGRAARRARSRAPARARVSVPAAADGDATTSDSGTDRSEDGPSEGSTGSAILDAEPAEPSGAEPDGAEPDDDGAADAAGPAADGADEVGVGAQEESAEPAAAVEDGDVGGVDGVQDVEDTAAADAALGAAGEPAEEDTDAGDLLLVVGLEEDVLVEDEHPRYHLIGCAALRRETEPLPVREARELGFTPCAQCGPDAELARRHHEYRAADQPS